MITGILSSQNLSIWQKSNSAITGDNGRLFNAGAGSGYERAVINNPQSSGKWFYAVEVCAFSMMALFLVFYTLQSVLLFVEIRYLQRSMKVNELLSLALMLSALYPCKVISHVYN